MKVKKTHNVEIREDNLYFNCKDDFLLGDDYEEVFSFIKTYADGKCFKKIEIDFENTLFEVTELLEKLIMNSYLFKNKGTEVVLNMGRIDLESRIGYLRCLNKLKIKNYEINYFKKLA